MTTPLAPDAGAQTLERECNCPPWVSRCAHFEGRWIIYHVVDNCGFPGCTVGIHHDVCTGAKSPTWGSPFSEKDHNFDDDHKWLMETCASEADALAAFYVAEEALLRTDPDAPGDGERGTR